MPTVRISFWLLLATICTANAAHHGTAAAKDLSQAVQAVSESLPPESVQFHEMSGDAPATVLAHLPASERIQVGRVNKMSKADVGHLDSSSPKLQLDICLGEKLRQAIKGQSAASAAHQLDPLQTDRSWAQCYKENNQEPRVCDLTKVQLPREPDHTAHYFDIYRKSVQNWCDLALNRRFEWLKAVMQTKDYSMVCEQFDVIAHLVEYLEDRDAAAALNEFRLRFYTDPGFSTRISFTDRDTLMMMDTSVRYPALIRVVWIHWRNDISNILLYHIYWRARAKTAAEPYEWSRHELYRQAVPDHTSPLILFDWAAEQLSPMNEAKPEMQLSPMRLDASSQIIHYYHYQHKLAADILTYTGQELSEVRLTNLAPFYIIARYLMPESAIRFYETAYKKRKYFSAIVFAGTSTKGTGLLAYVFTDVLQKQSPPSAKSTNFFDKLDYQAGLTLLPALCAMFHTNDNWTVFQDRFTDYIVSRNLGQSVVDYITGSIDKFSRIVQNDQHQMIQRLRQFIATLPSS